MTSGYRKALDYLYGFTDYEKQSGYTYDPERFDLGRVERLLARLGNPHQRFKSVHIAGTKGKGSTAAMTASVLQRSGYRTALYTSPHLYTFRERIQVDGRLISEQEIISGVERIRAVAPQVPGITTFELITALAFDAFYRQESEWAVLEVGMGGRLDATNVVTPQVSVITPISYDHTMYLGDTLAAIAAEKAGIIKPHVPVVSAPQPSEAREAIARIAGEKEAPLTVVDRDWQWQSVSVSAEASSEGQQFAAWPIARPSSRSVYTIPLLGQHQLTNATTALATLAVLQEAGLCIPEHAKREGLQSVRWPGRLQVLGRHPWVIVDGAHNGDSMEKLFATITALFPYRKLIVVFGISADKDLDRMLDVILPNAHHILVTQTDHPRAAKPQALLERIASGGKRAKAVPLDHVLDEALRLAEKEDLICVTGSLFLVAAFGAAWYKHTGEPLPPAD